MTFFNIAQLIIFVALLLNTVHLMPSLGHCLRSAEAAFNSGYLCTLLGVRLARNVLGLILVTASTAPNPEIHALVPKGILLFVALAAANVALTQHGQRSRIESA